MSLLLILFAEPLPHRQRMESPPQSDANYHLWGLMLSLTLTGFVGCTPCPIHAFFTISENLRRYHLKGILIVHIK